MKPIHFKYENTIIGSTNPNIVPLPAYQETIKTYEGLVISCWKGSLWERIKFLFTGKLWHYSMTFGDPVQPILVTLEYPFDERTNTTNETKNTSKSI